MTEYPNGDIDSGLAYINNVWCYDPFVKRGNLTWVQPSSRIDSGGTVITDLIMAGKSRIEGSIIYTYAIGHTGRLYKIQSNDPTTFNPDYDNPVLLATLTSGSPTFTRGGFIDFFGSTERIYIGHDKGVTRIDFNGTNETAVSGTWTQDVPRPLKQFLGKLYIGNGTNIAEIDSTATVTTSTKLSPGFPTNSQVRDIDVTPAGNYLQMVVNTMALGDITSASAIDIASTVNSESYIFDWNGTDTGYTAFQTFRSFSLTANTMFQNYQYAFGYDQYGSATFNPSEKIITSTQQFAPLPNAVSSSGNLLGYAMPLYFTDHLELTYSGFGSPDRSTGQGFWSLFGQLATGDETDIVQVPFFAPISNFGQGASNNGYTNNIFSTAKVYFSTLETSSSTTDYKLYKWNPVNIFAITSNAFVDAFYQTQTQLFSKKITVKQVRVYGDAWVANNSFKISLIDGPGTTNGTAMANGEYTFTAGSTLTVGNDYAWWDPQVAPTYALGLGVTNLGSKNHTIKKVEIDYEIGGV